MKKIIFSCLTLILYSLIIFSQDNKKLSDEYLNLADQLNKEKKYSEAEIYYKKAEESSPNNGRYSFRLGQFYLDSLNKYSDAIKCYEKAISKGYVYSWVYRQYGYCYYKLNKLNQAEILYKDGLKLAYNSLKEAKNENEKNDAKTEIFRISGRLGYIYNDLAEWDKTIEILEKLEEIEKNINTKEYVTSLFIAYWWKAHIYFGKGDFDNAIIYFEKSFNISKRDKDILKLSFNRDREVEFHIEIAKKRKTLGNINPDYTHKILVIAVKEVDIDTSYEGKIIKGHNFLTDTQRKLIEISQNSLKSYWEIFSNGKLSIDYKIIEIDNVMKGFEFRPKDLTDTRITNPDEVKETREPDFGSFSPSIDKIIYENYKDYDTFIIYWNGENGLATYSNGGGRYYPIISYNLYIKRGYSHLSTERLSWNGPALLLHEQMHNIESILGEKLTIDANEKDRKIAYPDWKTTGEINYFSYLFEKVIPKHLYNEKKFLQTQGWKNFCIRERFSFYIENNEYQNLFKLHNTIPIDKQKKSYELYLEAKKLYENKKIEDAIKTLNESINLNPYNVNALETIAYYLEQKNEYEKALYFYKKSTDLYSNVWALTRVGSLLCWRLKDIDSGLKYFEKSLSTDKDNPYRIKTLINIGYVYYKKKEFLKALSYYEEGIEFGKKWKNINQKDWAECYFYKGIIIGEEYKRYNEAIELLKEALNRGYDEDKCNKYLKKFKE